MKNRTLVSTISARLMEKEPLIQVIVGPRQVGKTTALKEAIGATAVYESADNPTPTQSGAVEEWWNEALNSESKILAIDEVQKVSAWTEVLKKLWDKKPKALKVIVTGSSALLLEKGLKESLAGRFELIRAEHWNYKESKNVFNLSLNEFIEFGCYPGSMPMLKSDINRWGQYVRDSIIEPAIGRDLLQLYPVDQPALLRQVFGAAVSLPAQVVSLQKIQGQLQGKGTLPTIQHYLKLLSDAFLVSGVEKYSKSLFRTRKSSPKLIIHDNGLLRSFEKPITQSISPEKMGHYFENCIGARFIEAGWDTYYWKDRDLEVDFVVIGPNGEKWAVEAKSSKTTEKEMKGLLKFCELHKGFEPILISLIGQKFDGIRALDAEEILSFSRKY